MRECIQCHTCRLVWPLGAAGCFPRKPCAIVHLLIHDGLMLMSTPSLLIQTTRLLPMINLRQSRCNHEVSRIAFSHALSNPRSSVGSTMTTLSSGPGCRLSWTDC